MRRMIACLLLCCMCLCWLPFSGQAAEASSVKHYLVLGRDAYSPSSFSFSRTDTVLVVSLDAENNQIVLTSLLRDIKVTTPKGAENKLNSVFRNHGFEGIKSTVEGCLGIDIEGTIVIDYDTVKALIDALGGVEIEIDINEYAAIKSILQGKDPNMPKGPGLTQMTGRIALAYMRDRSTGSGDFSRTERQRKVLGELLKACREMTLPELLAVYNVVKDGIETDLSAMQLLSGMRSAYTLMQATVVNHCIPQPRTYSYARIRSGSVLDVQWEKNRERFYALFQPAEEVAGLQDAEDSIE